MKDIRNGSMFNLTVNVLKAGESFGVRIVVNLAFDTVINYTCG